MDILPKSASTPFQQRACISESDIHRRCQSQSSLVESSNPPHPLVTPLTPLHASQSYRVIQNPLASCTNAASTNAIPRKFLPARNKQLLAPPSSQHATPSRQSANSLKIVHFQAPETETLLLESDGEHLVQHRRTQSASSGTSVSTGTYHSENGSYMPTGDKDDEEEDAEEEIGMVPPDGGWGWVVVAASFLVNLIADGATFSFGVIYVEFLKYFKESRSKTAWIGGLFMAMPLLSGPLASSLTDRYGCRCVTIAGSLLATLGFVASSFTNSLEVLFFTFGIVSGFGLSLCYVAAIVIVAYYFEKRRSLATGLAVCGSGIGTFIFAPLTQYLIDEYGWRGTTLLIAGCFLQITVCGALMRDLKIENKSKSGSASSRASKNNRSRPDSECAQCEANSLMLEGSKNGSINPLQPSLPDKEEWEKFLSCPHTEEELDHSMDDIATRLCNSLIHLPTFVRNGEKVPDEVWYTLWANPPLYDIIIRNYPALLALQEGQGAATEAGIGEGGKATSHTDVLTNVQQQSTPHVHGRHFSQRRLTTAYLKNMKVNRRCLTHRGAMLNLPRYRLRVSSCPDIYRNSMTTIAQEKEGLCGGYWEDLVDIFREIFDFSHLADIRFALFAISNLFLYTWYDVPYIYLADRAIERGFPEEDASFLLSVVGILNTLGVVVLGFVGDRSWANATAIYAFSMLICGLSTAVVPLLQSYAALATASGMFGLSIAANYSLASIILVDLISLERFTNAYGLLLLFQGIANLIGPPLAGWITDLTGEYDLSFYISGAFIVFSGLILMVLPIGKRFKKMMNNYNVQEKTEFRGYRKQLCEFCCPSQRLRGKQARVEKPEVV